MGGKELHYIIEVITKRYQLIMQELQVLQEAMLKYNVNMDCNK